MSYPWVEGGSLEARIEFTIESYEDENLHLPVRVQGFTDDKNQEFARVLEVLGKWVIDVADELSTSDLAILDYIRKIITAPVVHDTIHERLQIAAAWRYATQTSSMADRGMDLLTLVVEEQPPEPVIRFLRRVSRCYVAGYFPECVVMCRAVVENALRDKYAAEGMPLPENEDSTFRQKLDLAKTVGWISAQARRDALAIWKRGSIAAHRDPHVTNDALGTIRMTIGVLRALAS